jgi:hypothetical protein
MTSPVSQQFLGDDDEVWNAVDTLDRARGRWYERFGRFESLDRTTTIERARRYLSKVPPAISGQRGRAALWHAVMLMVHGFDLPPEDVFELLQDWNRGCVPPWNNHELQATCWRAHRKSATEPRGYLLRGHQ